MSGQTTPTKRAPPPIPDQIPDELSFKPRRDDEILSAEEYLAKLQTASQPPVKVVKPNSEELCYRKEIRIRYLQPPTPPPPAPIIIREKQLPPPPAPSVRNIIRIFSLLKQSENLILGRHISLHDLSSIR